MNNIENRMFGVSIFQLHNNLIYEYVFFLNHFIHNIIKKTAFNMDVIKTIAGHLVKQFIYYGAIQQKEDLKINTM